MTDDERPPIWTGHLVLYSTDPKRSGAFYEKLGLRPWRSWISSR